MSNKTFAGTAGRITGAVYAHVRRTAALIDWLQVGQVVAHGLITLAVMTFVAGEFTGRALHRLNDELARRYRQLLVGKPSKPTETKVITSSAKKITTTATVPAAPAVHPTLGLAEALMALPHRELQLLVGCRRKTSKAKLVELALAY